MHCIKSESAGYLGVHRNTSKCRNAQELRRRIGARVLRVILIPRYLLQYHFIHRPKC